MKLLFKRVFVCNPIKSLHANDDIEVSCCLALFLMFATDDVW